MNKNGVGDYSPLIRLPARKLLVLLPLALALVVSCGRGNDEPAPKLDSEAPLPGAATLTCSDECLQRSQCGTIDGRWVVLLSTGNPATESHDLTLPADTEVTINEQQMVLIQDIMSATPAWLEAFYRVNTPDQGAGWVAGWCITR